MANGITYDRFWTVMSYAWSGLATMAISASVDAVTRNSLLSTSIRATPSSICIQNMDGSASTFFHPQLPSQKSRYVSHWAFTAGSSGMARCSTHIIPGAAKLLSERGNWCIHPEARVVGHSHVDIGDVQTGDGVAFGGSVCDVVRTSSKPKMFVFARGPRP